MKTWQPFSRYSADGWRLDTKRTIPFDDGTDLNIGFVRVAHDRRTAVLVLSDSAGGVQAWRRDLAESDSPVTLQSMTDSLEAEQRDAAYRTFIDRIGSDEQRSALEAGTLSDEDGWKLIRDSIFANMESTHRRYKNIEWRDVDGAKSQRGVFASGDLTVRSFDLRVSIERVLGMVDGATVLPRWHRAILDGKVVVERFSVRVSVPFHGKALTREYDLPEGVVHSCDLGS